MGWPDWRDPSSYHFPELDDYAGWAWEFLRRNRKFQKACDGLGKAIASSTPEEVAKRWGLRKFKSYTEPHDGGARPTFNPGRVRLFAHPGLPIKKRVVKKIRLRKNDVAIVFDLRLALRDQGMLRTQIERANQRLTKKLKALASLSGNELKHRRIGKEDPPVYLRVFDAIEVAGESREEVAKKLYSHLYVKGRDVPLKGVALGLEHDPAGRMLALKRVKDDCTSAKTLVTWRYRSLAAKRKRSTGDDGKARASRLVSRL